MSRSLVGTSKLAGTADTSSPKGTSVFYSGNKAKRWPTPGLVFNNVLCLAKFLFM